MSDPYRIDLKELLLVIVLILLVGSMAASSHAGIRILNRMESRTDHE